jgi:hypothetical protein
LRSNPPQPPKRWHDREPLRVWVPLSALIAAVIQTIAYLGYKTFYLSFGVRPEEVGYDYATLFPRTILQVTLLFLLALFALGLLSAIFALYGAFGLGMFRVGKGAEAQRDSRAGSRQLNIAVGASALVFVFLSIGAFRGPSLFAWFFAGLILATVFLEHVLALRASQQPWSWLMAFSRPRAYRGGRRLALIGAATWIVVTYDVTGGEALLIVLGVYAADRLIPVVNPAPLNRVEGGGSSPWLWGLVVLLVTGVVATLALTYFGNLVPKGVRDKQQRVRAGMSLVYDPVDPFVLAEPQADRVLVRWVGVRATPPLKRDEDVAMTFLGQNNGVSVFLHVSVKGTVVYRFPTGMVAMSSIDPHYPLS